MGLFYLIASEARPESGRNRSDFVVTDKTVVKEINIIEMACPRWRNRADTEQRKNIEYTNARPELGLEENYAEIWSVQESRGSLPY